MAAGRLSFLRHAAAIPWSRITSEAIDRALLIAKTVCAVHVVNTCVCSQKPTINITGDIVTVERISPLCSMITARFLPILRSSRMAKAFRLCCCLALASLAKRVGCKLLVASEYSSEFSSKRFSGVGVVGGGAWLTGVGGTAAVWVVPRFLRSVCTSAYCSIIRVIRPVSALSDAAIDSSCRRSLIRE
ncbi:hypothetical protein KSP40_PGU022431 [Platanthera guangdongensis]|uniref:Secreted protein n=1 Tax=Platanthera guangdongensis TaxID=2320717 RepID=A0ABR2M9M2_9ASPA